MPLSTNDILCHLSCGAGDDGHWHGWWSIHVKAEALRPLGLHPDQPSSVVQGPSPPAW